MAQKRMFIKSSKLKQVKLIVSQRQKASGWSQVLLPHSALNTNAQRDEIHMLQTEAVFFENELQKAKFLCVLVKRKILALFLNTSQMCNAKLLR